MEPKLRILFVIPKLKIGGGEKFVVTLINYLAGQCYCEIGLLNLNFRNYENKNPLEDILQIDKIAYYTCKKPILYKSRKLRTILNLMFPGLYFFLVKRYAKKYIQAFKPDIISSHLFDADKISLSLNSGIPVVITDHGDYKALYPGSRELLLKAAKTICVSESNKQNIIDQFGIHNLQVIENGVSMGLFTIKVKRQDLSLPENSFIFTMVARGEVEKGWMECLIAFSRNKYFAKSFLVFVGEGEGITACKEYLKQHKIENVLFTGFQLNPQEYIANSDAVVLPTYFLSESCPLSLLEAISLEKPVISTNVGGIPSIVGNGDERAGILIDLINERPDIEQLKEAMENLIDNYEIYRLNTKKHKTTNTMDKCAAQYIGQFHEILKSNTTETAL